MIATLLAAALTQTPVTIPMKRDLRRYDFAGTKERKSMYMPTSIRLDEGVPKGVTLPAGAKSLLFGSLELGNGPKRAYWMALDPATNQVWLDANQNNSFQDDPKVAVDAIPAKDGGPSSFQMTLEFKASYAQGNRTWTAPYAMNFYWREGAKMMGCYRATAFTGSMMLDGKRIEAELQEANNQGIYHERWDTVKDPLKLRPITLTINGERIDPRGTFTWNGVNYIADISPDGTSIKLTPTFKVVKAPTPPPAPPKPLLAAGTPAPDFIVEAASGGTKKLSEMKGKIVILKFWATWCGPCIASMPHFESIYKQVSSQNVELMAICVADDKTAYEAWMPKNAGKFTYPFYFDPAGRTNGIHSRLFNVSGIPTVFVIDKDGKVAGSIVGYMDGDRRVEALLRTLGVQIKD